MVGLGRLELPTSRLSSARSNQLSYKPELSLKASPESAPRQASRPLRGKPVLASEPSLGSEPVLVEERETKAAKSRKWSISAHLAQPRDARGPLFQVIR